MTSFLRLTTNMAEAKTLAVPSDENYPIDLSVQAGKGTRKLSFTTVPETPPDTPPNDDNTSEIPGK